MPPAPDDWAQPARGYRFTGDSVALARFLPGTLRGTAADLGAGCGVVALEALAQGRLAGASRVFLLERDPAFLPILLANAARARRLVPALPPVEAVIADWRDIAPADLGGPVSLAFSNPPYFRPGTGRPPASASLTAPPPADRLPADAPPGDAPPASRGNLASPAAAGHTRSAGPSGAAGRAGDHGAPGAARHAGTPAGAATPAGAWPVPGRPAPASRATAAPAPPDADLAGGDGRWELHGGIGGLAAAAARILAPGGSFRLCFPRRRLPDLLKALARAGLAPSLYRFPAHSGLPLLLAGAEAPATAPPIDRPRTRGSPP
jgi:tRNA1(Val) A37 N6-methylase TrmN6